MKKSRQVACLDNRRGCWLKPSDVATVECANLSFTAFLKKIKLHNKEANRWHGIYAALQAKVRIERTFVIGTWALSIVLYEYK
ncbi:MAG: hypothetical protein D6735_03355 [Acidobacteria bacterium]|jgi:hypothetical protein|nr:MAG: hypothetical protein D6735_03355 [Acidobacteriota bacterium]